MEKFIELGYNDYFEDYSQVFGLNQITTVSSGSDNGANNCLASKFNGMRHDTTRHAINNFLSRLNSRNQILNICGHGNSGLFETGAGQSGWDDDKIVTTWNPYIWRSILKDLNGKKFPILTIYSCTTGAGTSGANLLWEMAKIIGKPVRGRTGLMYCGSRGVTYAPGSTWQTAHPNARPNPIPEAFQSQVIVNNAFFYFVKSKKFMVKISTSKVISSSVQTFGTKGAIIETPLKLAKEMSTIILNQTIQLLPGEVLGFLTIAFKFEIESEGKPKKIYVEVYNDRVAVVKKENIMFNLPIYFRKFIGI